MPQMQESRTYAIQIASFAVKLTAEVAFEKDVQLRQVITLRLIDTIACMRGAFAAETVVRAQRMASRYHAVSASTPGASLAAQPVRIAIDAAAFANGIAARYLDFNDIYLSKEAVHPSDNIPACIAMAEALGASGEELLIALIVGYEVHCRLADTLSTRQGKWDNVILGAIAASVMAGTLLKLDVQQLAQAICMAATGNIALMQTRTGTLSEWKSAAAAYAARAGVFSALAAFQGISAPALAFEGAYGLFSKVTGQPDKNVFMTPVKCFRLTDTHLKAYPSQYFTQTAISAALSIRNQINTAEAEKIMIHTFEFGLLAAADTKEKWRPTTRETADHSMPYCVAVALLDGELTTAKFEDACLRRDDVRALMEKIEVAEDIALTAQYPAKVPTRIQVVLRGGQSTQTLMDYPLGHSQNPMSAAQVAVKFTDLCGDTAPTRTLFDDLLEIGHMNDSDTSALLCRALQA